MDTKIFKEVKRNKQIIDAKKFVVLCTAILAIVLLTFSFANATIKTSTGTGAWSTAATWSPSGVPATSDTVVVLSGHTVTISANTNQLNKFTLNSGGIIDGDKYLYVKGALIINGAFNGTGRIYMYASGGTIDGTGTITGASSIIINAAGTYTILSTANIVYNNPNACPVMTITTGATVTNNGSFAFTGFSTTSNSNITGSNATTSIWTNGENSTVKFNAPTGPLATGVFNCSATGNTVEYTGASQTLRTKILTYYNLKLSGSGTPLMPTTQTVNILGDFTNNGTTPNFSTSTFVFGGSTEQKIGGTSPITFYKLTVSGTGGVTTSTNITVNNILNLSASNPSPTKGCLDIGSAYLLNMGVAATTSGTGDVTGIVKRTHAFTNGVAYSFGSQNTTITFLGISTKPTDVSCKIAIGTAPSWRTSLVQRYYSFSQTGGTDKVSINLRYLDAEINSNDESKLVLWDAHNGPTWSPIDEHGKSNNDATNNWVGLSGLGIDYIAKSSLDNKQWDVSNYSSTKNAWQGLSTVWNDVTNWSGGHVPYTSDDVLIPAGKTNYPSLTLAVEVKTLEMESGASLTANSYNITINGYNEAWNNHGTFNPGSGTVIFSQNNILNIVSITGTTNFYNIQNNANTFLLFSADSYVGIAGTISNNGTIDCTSKNNTVEYKGTNQTIIVPNASVPGFHNLIISNTGTKTFPSTLEIDGDFTNNGTVSTGTGTVTFNGHGHEQTISGTTATSFYNLTLNNLANYSSLYNTNINSNISVSGTLTVNSGADINPSSTSIISGSGTLTGDGELNVTYTGSANDDFLSQYAITNKTLTGITVHYTGASSQKIGGSTSTVNKFVLDNATGISLSQDLTVNEILDLRNGLLTLGTNNLILGSSASIAGTPSATNMIVATGTGELRKVFTGIGSFVYPVGSNNVTAEYSPVTLNFTAGTFSSAYAGVKLSDQKYVNNASSSSYLERYWTVSQNGISSFSCAVTLQYLTTDVFGNEIDIYCGKYDGSSWILLAAANTVTQELSGTVTGFSTFTGGEQGVLPVSLKSLNSSVNGRNVKLNWTTSFEINNSGFDVERKTLDGTWSKAGYVKGNGNNASSYSFEDRNLQTGKYSYRLKQIDVNGNFEYHNLNGVVEVGVPAKYDLSQNYPNPFNPVTKINFELPFDSKVKMIVYDVTGREIKTLVNEVRTAGYHTIVYDASLLSSGVYFYRIIANANGKDFISTKKMAIIK